MGRIFPRAEGDTFPAGHMVAHLARSSLVVARLENSRVSGASGGGDVWQAVCSRGVVAGRRASLGLAMWAVARLKTFFFKITYLFL